MPPPNCGGWRPALRRCGGSRPQATTSASVSPLKNARRCRSNRDTAPTSLRSGYLGSEPLSRGEYGAGDGVPRILRLLAKQNVPASFYIPAVSSLLHPQMVKDIVAAGKHEIGIHGWIHEDLPALNNEAEEQRMLNQAIETLTRAIGKKPVGYRAPSWHFSQYTMKQVT